MGNGDQPPRGAGQPPGDDEKTVWIPPNRPPAPPGPAQHGWNAPTGPPPGTGAGAPPQPPYPHQWQPPPSNGGQWKWIALAAVGVLVIVGSVVVIARSGGDKSPTAAPPGPSTSAAPSVAAGGESQPPTSTTPSTPETTTGAEGLIRYFLTQAEIQDALKEPVTAIADGTEPIAQTTDREDCGGALLMPTTYGLDGVGHTALATQLLQNPNDQGRIRVLQWVIDFPDGPAAAAYVANEYQRWDRCRLKTVSLTEDDRTSQWTVGVPQTTGSQVTNLAHQRGAGDWWCQQTGVARGTVVVGAQVCQAGSSTKAMSLAGAMAKKVAE